MNNDTIVRELPALTANMLREGCCLIDNLFADLWKSMGMTAILNRIGFNKRSGIASPELVFCLMVWTWLKVNSINMFAREALQAFSQAQKDALYGALNREDWNWRRLHKESALQAVQKLGAQKKYSAFILDDSIKQRSGKKMPGVSSHFDHTSGRCVMGQQVLTLGLGCAEGFVPLDSEIFISETKAQGLHQKFLDGRSVVAKRYRVALDQTKPEMAESMMKRAIRAGIEAAFMLADSWFCTKTMINIACELGLTAVLRAKKNKTKYRLAEHRGDEIIYKQLDMHELYQICVRCKWDKIPGQKYQAKVLDVELNLNDEKKGEAKWLKVRLLFVRGINIDDEKAQAGKHDWAVFLTTDITLEPQRILELYAMRWSIEVYFKEAKQHLGFLKEQSNHYAAYVASIHLAAIRFCMLVVGKCLHNASGICDVRKQLTANVASINYATQLWQVFRAIISGALDEMKALLGELMDQVMETIERHVQTFFVQALQLDTRTMRLESQ
jgi:SRSO17 transposase